MTLMPQTSKDSCVCVCVCVFFRWKGKKLETINFIELFNETLQGNNDKYRVSGNVPYSLAYIMTFSFHPTKSGDATAVRCVSFG